MFEQDYIMRLIKEFVRVLLKLIFQIEAKEPTEQLMQEQEVRVLSEELLDRIDRGEINEAENLLYDLIEEEQEKALEVALLFYSYLNDKTDDFLESNGFSRMEIKQGVEGLADRYGLGSVVPAFLMDV